MVSEQLWLQTACVFYSFSFITTYLNDKKVGYFFIIASSLLGLIAHTLSLAIRWSRVEHGPFINLYEILSSNVWSLMLAFIVFMLLAREYRQMGRYIVPILALLMIWLLLSPAQDTHLPPTYNTVWLYFHVLSGKFFLALLLLATGMAIFETVLTKAVNSQISIRSVQSLGYYLLAFAFCFESLMLLFGAIWAQDAWGRYWSWDPLETWAFLTWLAVVFVLHWRSGSSTNKLYPVLVIGCFVLAFLTFFGVPFISTAPHKGMI